MSDYKLTILNNKHSVEVLSKDNIGIEKCVYKLTFPDDSIYIGVATQNVWDRIQNHTTHFMNSKTRKDKAIKKFRKFKVDILRVCESEAEALYYERVFIEEIARNIYYESTGLVDYDKSCRHLVKHKLLNDTNY